MEIEEKFLTGFLLRSETIQILKLILFTCWMRMKGLAAITVILQIINEDPSNSSYCGYAKNDYSFNVTLNATIPPVADYRAISETIVIVNWGEDDASDNSLNNNYQVLNKVSINLLIVPGTICTYYGWELYS